MKAIKEHHERTDGETDVVSTYNVREGSQGWITGACLHSHVFAVGLKTFTSNANKSTCLNVSRTCRSQGSRGGSRALGLTTSLELDCVAEEDDTGPEEELEECLLRDSEVLLRHFPRVSLSSARLLLHLSSC